MAKSWLVRFARNLLIFSQIFPLSTNLSVSALTNLAKERCVGKHQLGVDVASNFILSKMSMKYNDFDKIPTESIMENNGHVLKIELNYKGAVPTIEVDFTFSFGVFGKFRLKCLYFQWFKTASKAYRYGNITFPAELHAVFYDVNARSYEDAVALNKSIIALAFGIKVNPLENDFNILKDNLKHVRQPNSKTPIKNVELDNWVKGISPTFMAYQGSFPDFSCQAALTWVHFGSLKSITVETIEEFQQLKAHEGNPLMGQVSETSKPKGSAFIKSEDDAENATKNNLGMPGLIIGVLLMIFYSF